jgi:MoaA/NifB/PqqE/SkfB family radical SAM enzyme
VTTSLQPSTLFVQLTTECNYRCRYCHMWTLKDDPSALTTAEKTRLISDFHELNPAGQVVFTGGETMMKKAEFFSLTRHCRTLGLRSAANTNGSFIQPEDHDILMCDGPNYLVLSLDSNLSSLHDYSRGVPGSFVATVATIAALLRARGYQSGRSMVEIITNSVVSADNIEGLFDFLAFVTELGVDGATLQILSPTFHRRGGRDVFYERHFFKDKGRAVAVLDELRHRREEFPVLRITDTDLRWMQMYIERPEFLDEPVCNSHERNIMVDYLGDVQLCFDMRQIFDGKPIGNIRLQPLHVLWGGQRAAAAREIMEHCRRSCGMLNCHRRPV